MLFTRRNLVIAGLSAAMVPITMESAYAARLFDGVPDGQAPGDHGYKHAEYHPFYQKVFGEIGKCACGTGDCRVSDWRKTQLGSPYGYDVIAYRQWRPLGLPLTEKFWIPDPDQVPPELRTERAHICAYDVSGISIPCAIINVTQS